MSITTNNKRCESSSPSNRTEKNMPNLRFTEFNGDWKCRKLKELTKINQGLQIAIADRFSTKVEGSYFYITNEFLRQDSKKEYYIKNPPKSVLCNENDILMTRTGNTGKVVTGVSGAFHNNFFKINFDRNVLNQTFFYYFLILPETQKLILRLAGTSTIPDLNHSDFYRIKLQYPTLPEQQKIASFLSSVDSKISLLQEKHSQLQQYKKGVMQQIFSQKLRFTQADGSAYPDWEEKKLGDVFETFSGLSGKSGDDFGSGKKYITYKQVFGDIFIDTDKFEYVKISDNEKQNVVLKGDVLITTSSETPNEIGYASVLLEDETPLYLNSFCFGLRNISQIELLPEFLGQLFRSPIYRKSVYPLAQGSTRFNLSKSNFLKLKLKFPSLEEQQKIAECLIAIDAKIDTVVDQLASVQAFKKGLLQKMFV